MNEFLRKNYLFNRDEEEFGEESKEPEEDLGESEKKEEDDEFFSSDDSELPSSDEEF